MAKQVAEKAVIKRKQLQKVTTMYYREKSELEDLKNDNLSKMDDLKDNIRQLQRETGLQQLIIDRFIPKKYQELIKQNTHWKEDVGEWCLRRVVDRQENDKLSSKSAVRVVSPTTELVESSIILMRNLFSESMQERVIYN
ncbi:hypothetical protein ACTXT7_017016 [Hymenolepis weldensis]